MRFIKREIKIVVLEGVMVIACKARKISVIGSRGSFYRDFYYILKFDFMFNEENEVVVMMWFVSNKLFGSLCMIVSYILNLFDGVIKGFRYKMRVVYVYFFVNINIEKNGMVVEICNFFGEKCICVCNMFEGVKSYRDEFVKDCIVFEGNDIDNVFKLVVFIYMVCLVKKKDIRKFFDGIYVSEKGIIEIEG